MNPIIIGIIVIGIIAVTVYTTIQIYEREQDNTSKSEWQAIIYSGNSVEPKVIYICKHCNIKEDTKYHYCKNCGMKMINGEPRQYYSYKIDLSDDE